jgi:hypothetical protein
MGMGMNAKKAALITCEAVGAEIEKVAPADLSIKVLEFGLHNHPNKLNQRLRECLDEVEGESGYQVALFAYGLCSNGVVGLKPRRVKVVIPKVDDCISLFLGSRKEYGEQQRRDPGTFYLTKGWIEYGETPLAIYNQEVPWAKKYSPEQIHWVARETIKNYTRVALIKTGAYDTLPYEDYARETADLFGLKYEVLPGSLNLLKKLIYGHWDEDFVVVEPGTEITQEMFL